MLAQLYQGDADVQRVFRHPDGWLYVVLQIVVARKVSKRGLDVVREYGGVVLRNLQSACVFCFVLV